MSSAQNQEMSQFVHDEEEAAPADPTPKAKPMDWDRILAYKSFKVVRIKDKALGLLYWSIVTLVIMYIIIFALGIEGKHQKQEPGIGTVITKYTGKAFDEKGNVYDAADLRFPEVEPFGAFIMTRMISQKGQKAENCADYDSFCPCRDGAECVGEDKKKGIPGHCVDRAWCPSLGEGNADEFTKTDEGRGVKVISVKGLEHTVLKISAGIAFPGLGNEFFVAGKSETLKIPNPVQEITVGDLLKKADPPMKVDDLLQKGALIGVSFFWTCDVMVDCEPSVVVKRLDNERGFSQKRAYQYVEGGETMREAVVMYGLRFLVDSSGLGRQLSFTLIVIQIGSGLALLRTASMSADFMMLSLYPKVRADAYYKCKVVETKDYSDLQDRLNLIQDQQQQAVPLMAKKGPGGSGAGVNLGLGPGGRGGMASAVLRSRN